MQLQGGVLYCVLCCLELFQIVSKQDQWMATDDENVW